MINYLNKHQNQYIVEQNIVKTGLTRSKNCKKAIRKISRCLIDE